MLEAIELEELKEISVKAGHAIMEIYKRDFSIEYKDDKSPLTEADTMANTIICNYLSAKYPTIPILSEENKTILFTERKNWNYFWLIDPLDGTKEFIKKNDEFTVNIALIHKNTPILGIVYAPVFKNIYYAKKGFGAYKNNQKLGFRTEQNTQKLRIVASKSHLNDKTQEFIESLKNKTKEIEFVSVGSSLKICLLAENKADIYPRFAPTMEWDTAAAHIIINETGGSIIDMNTKKSLEYNKESLLNNSFLASSILF